MKYGVYGVSEWSDRSTMNPFFAALAMQGPDHVRERLIETFDTEKEARAKMKEMNRSDDRKGHDYFVVKKI